MKIILLVLALATSMLANTRRAFAQSTAMRQPVIDIHSHGAAAVIARPDSLNIRHRLVTVLTPDLDSWREMDRSRLTLAFGGMPCQNGRAIITGRPCLANGASFPDTGWFRSEVKAGRIQALAELVPQYAGMSPNDPRLDPFLTIAEEYDLPVGVHVGPGPPLGDPSVPFKSPEYRAALTNPLLLEEVLIRHKKLRLFLMHAGWPMLEPTIALLHAFPDVYVDVGLLQNETIVTRPAYYRYLRELVEAGFAKRIMFGSDFPAGQVKPGIDAILAADFLTANQKSDILCGNAMRFLRLPESTCRQ